MKFSEQYEKLIVLEQKNEIPNKTGCSWISPQKNIIFDSKLSHLKLLKKEFNLKNEYEADVKYDAVLKDGWIRVYLNSEELNIEFNPDKVDSTQLRRLSDSIKNNNFKDKFINIDLRSNAGNTKNVFTATNNDEIEQNRAMIKIEKYI